MDILHSIRDALLEAQDVLDRFIRNPENIATIAETAEMMQDVFERQGRIFTCGNGGSLCDAVHFAEECTGKVSGRSETAASNCPQRCWTYHLHSKRFRICRGLRASTFSTRTPW